VLPGFRTAQKALSRFYLQMTTIKKLFQCGQIAVAHGRWVKDCLGVNLQENIRNLGRSRMRVCESARWRPDQR
jgi:hypothetical protein